MSIEADKQIALLNNYIKALQGELNSYKKEIASFIKYYDIFEHYDQTVSQMLNIRNEKDRFKKTIRKMEQKVLYLDQLQNKYSSLQKDYETVMIQTQKIIEINQNYKAQINELMRNIAKLEEQKQRNVKIVRADSQSRTSVSEVSNDQNLKYLDLDQILQMKDGSKIADQTLIDDLKQKNTLLEMENAKLLNLLVIKQKDSSTMQDQKLQNPKRMSHHSNTLSIYHINDNNSARKSSRKSQQLMYVEKIQKLENQLNITNQIKISQDKQLKQIKGFMNLLSQKNKALRKAVQQLGKNIQAKDIQLKVKNYELQKASEINIKAYNLSNQSQAALKDSHVETLQLIIDDQNKQIKILSKKIQELRSLQNSNINIIQTLQQSNIMLKRQFANSIEYSNKLQHQIRSIRSARKRTSQYNGSDKCSQLQQGKKKRRMSQYLNADECILTQRKRKLRKSHIEDYKPQQNDREDETNGSMTDRVVYTLTVKE